MTHRAVAWMIAVALVLATPTGWWVSGDVVRAEEPPPVETTLTVETIPAVQAGEEAIVVAHLVDPGGEAIAGVGIDFRLDGLFAGRSRTDSTGTARLAVGRTLVAGSYRISVEFNGVRTLNLLASQASTMLRVDPAVFEIEVVPPIAGVQARVNDQTFTSDEQGLIQVKVNKAGTYRLEILPWQSPDPQMQASFARWSDSVYEPTRDIRIPWTSRLQLGFETSRVVSLTYVDVEGRPVDPAQIESVSLSASTGGRFQFEAGEPQWLLASRVARLSYGLAPTEVQYRVESVMIRGSNVVNRNQQEFTPAQGVQTVPVEILFYSARFLARDALFRTPVGSAIVLQFPDGHSERFEFGSRAELTLDALPRGDYKVTVEGPGISFTRPVSLSRNQEVRLEVVSYLDLALAGALLLALVLSLLFIGRPHLFGLRRKARRVSRTKLQVEPVATPLPPATGAATGASMVSEPSGLSAAGRYAPTSDRWRLYPGDYPHHPGMAPGQAVGRATGEGVSRDLREPAGKDEPPPLGGVARHGE